MNMLNNDGVNQQSPPRRKLRPLVISMGGERESHVRALFEQMKEHFEEPVFSPGIPARSLRTRSRFFQIAHPSGTRTAVPYAGENLQPVYPLSEHSIQRQE